jgi:hypothetical protein
MFESLFRWFDAIIAWFKSLISSWFGSEPASSEVVSFPEGLDSKIVEFIKNLEVGIKSNISSLLPEQTTSFWDAVKQLNHTSLNKETIEQLLVEVTTSVDALNLRSSSSDATVTVVNTPHSLYRYSLNSEDGSVGEEDSGGDYDEEEQELETMPYIPHQVSAINSLVYSPNEENLKLYKQFISDVYLFPRTDAYTMDSDVAIKSDELNAAIEKWQQNPIEISGACKDKIMELIQQIKQKEIILPYSGGSGCGNAYTFSERMEIQPEEKRDYGRYGVVQYFYPSERTRDEYATFIQERFIKQRFLDENSALFTDMLPELIDVWGSFHDKEKFMILPKFQTYEEDVVLEQFENHILIPYLISQLTNTSTSSEKFSACLKILICLNSTKEQHVFLFEKWEGVTITIPDDEEDRAKYFFDQFAKINSRFILEYEESLSPSSFASERHGMFSSGGAGAGGHGQDLSRYGY